MAKKYLDYTIDGVPVPGVTSFIKMDKSDAMIGWAVKCFKNGLNPYEERNKARDYGSQVHMVVDQVLSGQSVNPEHPMVNVARNFQAATAGWKRIGSEFRVKNRELMYCGTIDQLFEINGEIVLADIKTSNAVYPEYTLQLCAYKMGVPEDNPDLISVFKQISRCIILHLDKETGVWDWCDRTPQQIDYDTVAHLRKIYDWVKARANT